MGTVAWLLPQSLNLALNGYFYFSFVLLEEARHRCHISFGHRAPDDNMNLMCCRTTVLQVLHVCVLMWSGILPVEPR